MMAAAVVAEEATPVEASRAEVVTSSLSSLSSSNRNIRLLLSNRPLHSSIISRHRHSKRLRLNRLIRRHLNRRHHHSSSQRLPRRKTMTFHFRLVNRIAEAGSFRV